MKSRTGSNPEFLTTIQTKNEPLHLKNRRSQCGGGHRQDLRPFVSYINVITINCYVFQNICVIYKRYYLISTTYSSIDSSLVEFLEETYKCAQFPEPQQ